MWAAKLGFCWNNADWTNVTYRSDWTNDHVFSVRARRHVKAVGRRLRPPRRRRRLHTLLAPSPDSAKRSGAHALEALAPAFYVPPSPARRKRWRDWLARWRRAEPDVKGMNQVNPLFVPREWMLVEAYEAAERGDNSVIETLRGYSVDRTATITTPRWWKIRPPRARRRSHAGRRGLRVVIVNRRARKHSPRTDMTWVENGVVHPPRHAAPRLHYWRVPRIDGLC